MIVMRIDLFGVGIVKDNETLAMESITNAFRTFKETEDEMGVTMESDVSGNESDVIEVVGVIPVASEPESGCCNSVIDAIKVIMNPDADVAEKMEAVTDIVEEVVENITDEFEGVDETVVKNIAEMLSDKVEDAVEDAVENMEETSTDVSDEAVSGDYEPSDEIAEVSYSTADMQAKANELQAKREAVRAKLEQEKTINADRLSSQKMVMDFSKTTAGKQQSEMDAARQRAIEVMSKKSTNSYSASEDETVEGDSYIAGKSADEFEEGCKDKAEDNYEEGNCKSEDNYEEAVPGISGDAVESNIVEYVEPVEEV